ncbi:MAG: hypothetical protein WCK28_23050 [Burkholderiales bacterium]|jgi:hypothetical protein
MSGRRRVLVPVAALLLLAGCTTPPGHAMGGAGMGSAAGGMGAGMGGHGGGMGLGGPGGVASSGGDPAQQCVRYREMMAGRTPEAQQAAMEAQMRAMHGGAVTSEQARMEREAMEKRCAAGPGAR